MGWVAHQGMRAALTAAVMLSGMAAGAQAQVTDFGDRVLPTIPSTTSMAVGDLVSNAMPLGRLKSGIWVSPTVAVNRLINPSCVFVANQNSGGSQVVQRTSVGTVLMSCR